MLVVDHYREGNMPDRQDDKDKQVEVLTHLRAKGFDSCLVCGQSVIGIDGTLGFGVGHDFALTSHEDPSGYTNFVPVICDNCGHTLWFYTADLPGGRL